MLAVALSRSSSGLSDIERPHILEIFDRERAVLQVNEKNSFAGTDGIVERRREPGDAGVQGRPVLGNGGGVVAVEDLALRPLGSPVAGGAIGRKDRRTGRRIARAAADAAPARRQRSTRFARRGPRWPPG